MKKFSDAKKIQEEVELKGYKMITSYVRASENFIVECPNGHEWSVRISNFRRYTCPHCKDLKNIKYEFDFVYKSFKEREFELLSKEYKNCKQVLYYICKCGELADTTFDCFLSKNISGCDKCKSKRMWDKRAKPYIEIFNIIKTDGNLLLTTHDNYINENGHIDIKCSCGQEFPTTYQRYKYTTHKKCPDCAYQLAGINSRFTIEQIKTYLKDYNLQLLNYIYIKNKGYNITFKCKCDKTESIPFNYLKLRLHKVCRDCYSDIMSEINQGYTYEEVYNYFKENNCLLLSKKYKSVDSLLDYICQCGEKSKTNFYRFKEGQRCYECGRKKIKGENHWNWQGGITPEHAKLRMSEEYLIWRNAVLEKDNYKCIICNNSSNLHAHHLDNFAEYKEKRFDINNGVTLCENHHISNISGSFHNIYGTFHNTEEQFWEYYNLKCK